MVREVLLDPALMDRVKFPPVNVSRIAPERLAAIHDAVEGLPPDLREVIERYFWQGRRPGDIAKDTGKSRTTVYTQLRQAFSILEVELDADE